jgi:hypothetical protein
MKLEDTIVILGNVLLLSAPCEAAELRMHGSALSMGVCACACVRAYV